MTEFTPGYLVFKTVPTLGAAHSLASQMARLVSDVHILDVGFLVNNAWIAAWFPENKKAAAESAARDLKMEIVKVSSATMNAIFSLSPATESSDSDVLILEASESAMGDFFLAIENSLWLNWKLLEVRLRKSGPSGVHAFFVGPSGTVCPEVAPNISATSTVLVGDYRRFF